jgi:hypothetical protein
MTSRFESKVVIGTGVEAGIGAASACGFQAEPVGQFSGLELFPTNRPKPN